MLMELNMNFVWFFIKRWHNLTCDHYFSGRNCYQLNGVSYA
jgi:hypothetical protein